MDCREIRKLISRESDGELRPGEKEALASHLGDCPDCLAFREALSVFSAIGESKEDAAVPGRVSDAVFSRLERPSTGAISGWRIVAVSAAACLIMIIGAGVGYYVVSGMEDRSSSEQSELMEMRYLDAYPPDSVGEMLMSEAEGGRDV